MTLLNPLLPTFLDELDKIAASRLRGATKVTPEVVGYTASGEPITNWMLNVNREPSGSITTKGKQVASSQLDSKLRGMGLGKKMYGEVMRRMPEQAMTSDTNVSQAARGVWKSMTPEKGYQTSTPTLGKPYSSLMGQSLSIRPQFKSQLPAAAAVPVELSHLPDKEKLVRKAKIGKYTGWTPAEVEAVQEGLGKVKGKAKEVASRVKAEAPSALRKAVGVLRRLRA